MTTFYQIGMIFQISVITSDQFILSIKNNKAYFQKLKSKCHKKMGLQSN